VKTKNTTIRFLVAALALLIVSAVVVGGAVDAQAQSSRMEQEAAKKAYREARKALNDGQYKNAAELFEQVYQEHRDSRYAAEAMYYRAFALNRMGGKSDLRNARRVLEIHLDKYSDTGKREDATALYYKVLEQLASMGDEDAARQLADYTEEHIERESWGESDVDMEEKMAALNALINMNPDKAMTVLEKIFENKDPENAALREKAVWLLSQSDSDESIDMLVDIARNDPDSDVQEQAVFWLSQTHSEKAVGVLEELLLESDDPDIQEKAIFALSQTGSDRAFAALRKIALDDTQSQHLRENAIFWLGQQGGRESVVFLKELYGQLDDPDLKDKVIFSVSQNSHSGDWLMEIVADEKEAVEVRKQALFWAGQTGAVDVDGIVNVYKKSKNMELREQAIFALSQSHGDEAIEAMIELARTEKNRELRKQLVFWIGQSGNRLAEDFLLEIIND
jgi:HEAT repeat protein